MLAWNKKEDNVETKDKAYLIMPELVSTLIVAWSALDDLIADPNPTPEAWQEFCDHCGSTEIATALLFGRLVMEEKKKAMAGESAVTLANRRLIELSFYYNE